MPSMPRLLVAALIAVAFSACQKQEPAAPAPAPASEPAPPAETAAAPAPEAAPVPAEAAPAENLPATGAIGVAECDDYLAKYEACVADKVPEAARASLEASLDATRAAWAQAVATPGGRDSLAAACKSMHESSRPSMQAYGCTDF